MPHKGSQETYDYISKWITPNFFFSQNDNWGRMGFLGCFGDFVLSSLPGEILEIGVGESSIYLSALAKKFNRQHYHIDIEHSKIINPLTVEGYLGENPITWMGSSNDFFAAYKDKLPNLALVFIDGDHSYNQVKQDFNNVLPYVSDNGYTILHDTYPPSEDYLDENTCFTVYKFRQELEKDDRFDCLTLTRLAFMGVGATIVRKKPLNRPYYQE